MILYVLRAEYRERNFICLPACFYVLVLAFEPDIVSLDFNIRVWVQSLSAPEGIPCLVTRVQHTFSKTHIAIGIVHHIFLRRVDAVEVIVGVHGGGRSCDRGDWECGLLQPSRFCLFLRRLCSRWRGFYVRRFPFPCNGRRCEGPSAPSLARGTRQAAQVEMDVGGGLVTKQRVLVRIEVLGGGAKGRASEVESCASKRVRRGED